MSGERRYDCAAIGAGPAGLAAAIAAVRRGARVCILEKNDRPGKKLLLTGGGRAEMWDPQRPPLDALEAYGRSGRFLRQALAAFDWAGFLADLGVRTERDAGRVYVTGGAKRLLGALLDAAGKLGVEVITRAAARTAEKPDAEGFEVETARGAFRCDRLAVAAGGVTYPGTGSSGDGCELAAGFGHELETPQPALGALGTEPCFPGLAGASVERAELLYHAGKKRRAGCAGALLFTHKGLSGPAALALSLELARAPGRGAGEEVLADLVPGLSREELVEALVARARAETKRSLGTAGLGELLPVRLLAELAERAGVNPRRRMGSISHKEFGKLAGAAKALAFVVKELPGREDAMITVGGVGTKSIEPRSMESRLLPGLHFAGEVLAPAGHCGGHNLLMAFATGHLAGANMGLGGAVKTE